MLNEYVKFTDNLSVQVYENSKHGTSMKDDAVKTFFNKTFSIYAKFKLDKTAFCNAENTYGVFAKQGMHSGVWLRDSCVVGLVFTQDEKNNVKEIALPIWIDEKEFYGEIQILFQVDNENKKVKLYVNDKEAEATLDNPVVDYSQAPFWIGACAPWYTEDLQWFFNGEIYEFAINEKFLNEEQVKTIFVNKGYTNIVNSEINESLFAWYEFTIKNFSRFKVFDKSNNGNHGIVPDWHFLEVRDKLQTYSRDKIEINEFGKKLIPKKEEVKNKSNPFNII